MDARRIQKGSRKMKVEIDGGSGFCFGVTRAIEKAEKELGSGSKLRCLGDIVHNGRECSRLESLGLVTIDHDGLSRMDGGKVLFRAHGEPPETYKQAYERRMQVIDATCPVVLKLQRSIKKDYQAIKDDPFTQIVIYGKRGHAEVLGLVGQTDGKAIVLEHPEEVVSLDMNKNIHLYSQTTKSLADYFEVVEYIKDHISPGRTFQYHDTICRQVANRMPRLKEFAQDKEVIIFVAGRKSSNGRVLYHGCLEVNPRTYFVSSPEEIEEQWFDGVESVGICGATSTPKWLMEQCRDKVREMHTKPL